MSELHEHLGWLIRDSANRIRGPFPRAEVLQLLKKNQLKIKTELSRANAYWFSLEEKMEVAKFFPELGIKPADDHSQMTATLTQANARAPVEATQVMMAPKPEAAPSPEAEAQWLDPEAAAEFGDLNDYSISLQTDVTGEAKPPVRETEQLRAQEETARKEREARARQEWEQADRAQAEAERKSGPRAQVKADTLPSEYHDYQGDRPKAINNIIKAPDRSSPEPASNIVSVPVESHEAHANIIPPKEKAPADPAKQKKLILGGAAAVVLLLLGALALSGDFSGSSANPSSATKQAAAIEPMLKKALLLYDLEGAKDALAEYELSPDAKGRPTLPLAQAVIRKDFLFDTEGALGALQMARTLARDPKLSHEIENLIAIYRFERDPQSSTEELRRLAEANPGEPVYRYNWALALERADHSSEAIAALTPLFSSLPKDSPLLEDAAVLLGWARDRAGKGQDLGAEGAFQRALEANPDSAKARLGVAIYRLRKGGLREAESDFRAFIESMPELDPPRSVPKFRQMSDFDFYRYARNQIAELNTPGPAVGNKPSPLIMAADAVISSMQSQTGDGNKIVTDALKAAPGDSYALKAMGYVLWKEGKYSEIAELYSDPAKDRNSFAVNLLLGKAHLKLGRRTQAEGFISALTVANPLRADGWSLLGDLNLSSGKAAEARQNFQQALSRDPFDLLALRGLSRLKDREVISPAVAKNLPF